MEPCLSYEVAGIEFDPAKNVIRIDLNEPRTIIVKAVNEYAGFEKTYVLKITPRGVCLV